MGLGLSREIYRLIRRGPRAQQSEGIPYFLISLDVGSAYVGAEGVWQGGR